MYWGLRSKAARWAAALAVVPAGMAALGGTTTASASPAYLSHQWGLAAVDAQQAWQYASGAGVKIGIVDTGVDMAQQDLQGKVVASTTILSSPSSGCATAQQDSNGQDDNGHGTHVSGIAAASGAYGVEGVAPRASLVVAKVLDCAGSGTDTDVEQGIAWVVQQGARVVNLSLGDAGVGGGLVELGTHLGPALQAAWNAGAIPVIAAGNNSNGLLGLGEQNYSGVPAVVVAATGPNNVLASYSNTVDSGYAQWGVAAPGGDDPNGPTTAACGQADGYEILSTFWMSNPPAPYNATNCYATDEGTSMATPFVTGALALLLSRGLSPTQAVQALLSTANHSVSCGSACSGLINAGAAVASLGPAPSSAPVSAPKSTPTSRPRTQPVVAAGSGTTTAPPVSTTAPTAGSASGTSSPSTSTTTKRLAAQGVRNHRPAGSGQWWLLLLIVALAVLVALVVAHRRDRALRAADAQPT